MENDVNEVGQSEKNYWDSAKIKRYQARTELISRLAKLIDVKTIVTFAVIGTFAYLSLIGKIETQLIMQVVTMVVAFYFGTQYQKNAASASETNTIQSSVANSFEQI